VQPVKAVERLAVYLSKESAKFRFEISGNPMEISCLILFHGRLTQRYEFQVSVAFTACLWE
jgi:hypothetical protein